MIIEEEIFRKEFGADDHQVRVSDLPPNLLPDDIIDIEREEGFYSENNSWNGATHLVVTRLREETDEERKKTKEMFNKLSEQERLERYQTYLQLKEEFEQ